MTPSKFEQDFPVPTYCFDINSQMRPAAFFEIAQDLVYGRRHGKSGDAHPACRL